MHLRYFETAQKPLKRLGLYKHVQRLLAIHDLKDRLLDTNLFAKSTFSPVFKYSTGRFLIKHFYGYMGHNANSSTGDLGYGYLHYAFIRALRPERVLCIGSKQGFIPAICALACRDNQYGHVDFVDVSKDVGDKNNWGGTNFWNQVDPNEHFAPFELNKYLTFHLMTSKRFAKKYSDRKFEYIYIDGDHSYEVAKFDYETFWPRLAAMGMLAFHDITMKGLSGGVEFGIWKLWQELKQHSKKTGTVMFSRGENNNALGFLQKLE